MKIFISSTVFDLVDVRSEVFSYLRELGYDVVLSDINLSSFSLSGDKSSIEVCLENVRQCDYFVLILDRRYGPTLEDFGYDKLSATHLEYREAIQNKKPIHAYARDRTFAEYGIFKKNPVNFEGVWVGKRDHGLFSLIAEHATLSQKDKNNWITTFATSVDLRQSIHKNLNVPYWKENLSKKIALGLIPLLTATQETEYVTLGGRPLTQTRVTVKNNSKSVAYLSKIAWTDDQRAQPEEDIRILLPGEDIFMAKVLPITATAGKDFHLEIRYASYEGIEVIEQFRVHAYATAGHQGAIISGINSQGRQFRIGKPVEFKIEESS